MSHDHDHAAEHEPTSYGTYVLTWLALLVLTAITVTAAGMHFGNVSVLVALLIATVKSTIVLQIFMHMRYESKLFHTMVWIVIVTLAIFIGLTFTDTLFR
jgi:cytochrome c oxidase subunit 4